jgi:hypothetical protein
MKKVLITFSFILAVAATKAQAVFSIGPTVGGSHAFLTGNQDWDFYPVWNAGITSTYGTREWWGIGADVRYSVEGSKIEFGSTTRTTRLDYIRVPIKGMIFFRKYEDDFRPKITLGPSVGFLVKEENDYVDTYNLTANQFDFGVNASVGFNYRTTENSWINFDINYYQGLMDVRDNPNQTEYNGNIGINLGFAIGLNRK